MHISSYPLYPPHAEQMSLCIFCRREIGGARRNNKEKVKLP